MHKLYDIVNTCYEQIRFPNIRYSSRIWRESWLTKGRSAILLVLWILLSEVLFWYWPSYYDCAVRLCSRMMSYAHFQWMFSIYIGDTLFVWPGMLALHPSTVCITYLLGWKLPIMFINRVYYVYSKHSRLFDFFFF